MKVSKKITLFGLSLAGLALLAFPHSGQAFELKEEWVIKGDVWYQDGKILRFNNGNEVDIKVLDLPETEKIEWTVSLNGQDQTVNFLGKEKDKSMVGTEGRYLNFYVPYGYRGDIKVEAKSGNEVKTWSTKVVDDVYNGGKSGYYRIKESNDQYTYLDTKWDYQTKTYTATLPETINGQKVYAWAEEYGNIKLVKPGTISHKYDDGGVFRELYPIIKSESWLNLKNNQGEKWYYQKQGQLVPNAQTWLYQGGNWYAFKSSGAMIASDWLYDNGSWYYLKDSGSMATGWVKDSGSWYYLASSGKMLHNTYTPDGYYVDASGAWK